MSFIFDYMKTVYYWLILQVAYFCRVNVGDNSYFLSTYLRTMTIGVVWTVFPSRTCMIRKSSLWNVF